MAVVVGLAENVAVLDYGRLLACGAPRPIMANETVRRRTSGTAVTNAIEISDLHVTIAGSHVLQGISLIVPSGGVTAILGRNGVGKTTTLRAILGLVASSGQIKVLDHEVSSWPTHRIVQLGIGYVPEDRDVFSGLT